MQIDRRIAKQMLLADHVISNPGSQNAADGRCIYQSVYAKAKEECEKKLAVMIEEMKKKDCD